MILAYNTNGLAHHALPDAIELLAEIGYRGVQLTLDHGVLNPYSHGLESQIDKLRDAAADHGLTYVVETGARYLLDSRHKHEPTLVSPEPAGRARRIEFLKRSIDVAKLLDARCVSLWSGVVHDGAPADVAWERLTEGILPVQEHAELKRVTLAFEPEPGMLVDTIDAYSRLKRGLESRGAAVDSLRLTVDIGHLHCNGEKPIAEKLVAWGDEIANLHIEDMRAGVHEHLQFGEGEIDFPPIIEALRAIGYDGLLGVELSRHSHEGPDAAQAAFDFLKPLVA